MAELQRAKKSKKPATDQRNNKLTNKTNEGDRDGLKLEDVIALGGSKEDFDMLKDLKHETHGKSKDVDKDLENEIKEFVTAVGLSKIPVQIENDDSQIDFNGDVNEESSGSNDEEEDVMADNDENANTNKKLELAEQMQISIPTFNKYSKSILKEDSPWHEQIPLVDNPSAQLSPNIVSKVQEVAKFLWENEVTIYQDAKASEKSSDAQWLRTVLTSGTQSDKVAALTMMVQEAPVHQMKRLESLIAMSKKKGRREAIMAIDSLRNLWVTDLLPDRKLRHFWQWPLEELKNLAKDSGKVGEDRILILWYFEDLLKSKYAEFVEALETLSRDTIPDVRNKATGTLYELLALKPEQEQKLLTLIANKLGDPNRKVASRALYFLNQLVVRHPNMKMVVIEEVERLLYRPNVSQKAQYYAICFLNQIIITKKENTIASKLISIYFSFFKVFAMKKISETKMLSALLTGVNRAFPYTQGEEEKFDEQMNTLFKVCHVDNFQTSVQALMLLFQVMDSRKSVSDRYYRVLYEKLFDHNMTTSSKHSMFLNILYKSIKADPAMNRIKAFLKRLMQIGAYEEPSFICSLLYLISEVIKVRPGVKSLIMQPEEEDDEEHFRDIEDDKFTAPNESLVTSDHQENTGASLNVNAKSGWTFHNQQIKQNNYDVSSRNPLFCGAQFSCAWEIYPLLRHFHPSVRHFAHSVLKDEPINYRGDPLQDFTLMRFLDRFMYKNPKKNPKEHGKSIMQPKKVSERLAEQPVNSKIFANRNEESIREDELFFHRYFKQKANAEIAKKDKKKKGKQDEDLIDEEENEVDIDEFDFAGEMERSKSATAVSKKKKTEEKDEDNDDEDDFEGDGDESDDDAAGFMYDDMDVSEDEDFNEDDIGKKQNFTDADYEKALLENMSDSGDELDDDPASSSKNGKSSQNVNSMFAAADEFAHILENSNLTKGERKQFSWEERDRSWKKTKSKKNNSGNKRNFIARSKNDSSFKKRNNRNSKNNTRKKFNKK